MAYTPTTWVTGDKVTATKLNKIEQGIANAGGGGTQIAVIKTDASGFSVASRTFASIAYAVYESGTWKLVSGDDYRTLIFGYDKPNYFYLATISDEVRAYIIEIMADSVVTTGGINSTAETLQWDYGSVATGCHRIEGSGTIQFISD